MTEDFGIGKTFKNGPPGQRDAVHAAVVLVSSSERVYPGDSLVFTDKAYNRVVPVRDPGPREYGDEEDEETEKEDNSLKRQAVVS